MNKYTFTEEEWAYVTYVVNSSINNLLFDNGLLIEVTSERKTCGLSEFLGNLSFGCGLAVFVAILSGGTLGALAAACIAGMVASSEICRQKAQDCLNRNMCRFPDDTGGGGGGSDRLPQYPL